MSEPRGARPGDPNGRAGDHVVLCLAGDVMTGRGVDQALPHPGDPALHEPGMPSAQCYVERAERQNGPLAAPVGFDELWGKLPEVVASFRPRLRLANLETVISTGGDAWPDKRYHFRMHPDNAPCLGAMGFDCLTLANNHSMDWGPAGLADTLSSLRGMGIRTAGAGRNRAEAATPATIEIDSGGRILVFAYGMHSSHIPVAWAAAEERAGVNLLPDLSDRSLAAVARQVGSARRTGDLVVLSIHWGPNWGFQVPAEQREFAGRLIDEAGVDVVHGHSAHHVRGVEVHRGKLVIHGCGDLLNDYERIAGRTDFLHDQSLLYLPVLARDSGQLVCLTMVPTRIRRFRAGLASPGEAAAMHELLQRECPGVGAQVRRTDDGYLVLRW